MSGHIIHSFRNTPISRKLMMIIMLTSTVALLLACTAFLVYEREALRESMARNFAIIADTFDDNLSSGLTFDDPESMDQTLNSLKADPGILGACVYNKAGAIVAQYQRADLNSGFQFPKQQRTGQNAFDDRLDTFQDITLTDEFIGSVYISSDYSAITQRLQRSIMIVVVVMAGTLLLALILSTRLQKVISRPISHLVRIANAVATEKDYSVRALKQSGDELGQLVDAFNDMLSQIEVQNSALRLARDDLEKRVSERTGELARSISLLNATLNSSADGIIAIQFNGEVVCYNDQFAEMWGIPPELLTNPAREPLLAFTAEQIRDPEAFLNSAHKLEAASETEAFDVLDLKDGRTFERYIKPQKVNGNCVGLVINFRDVTARKRSETQLAEANDRLMATSRQAGMAEVATSVLHNVGNVLNSVSVSAEVTASKVRQFRIGSLKNLAELLQENSHDLGNYLSHDARGKKVPEYLLKLVSHLSEPQKAILQEIDLLRKNIEHIKEIVSMQQTYARGFGLMAKVSVSELIEDAIRINEAGFSRHKLELVRQIADVPPILTDRHKVLQILVNLLGNAKHALSDAGPEKKLIIGAKLIEKSVQIFVIDNGIGIAPENLTRIFQHGFTTKTDGHGFGLHSGANAARELGGELTSYSAGVGQGATFTLELPLESRPF